MIRLQNYVRPASLDEAYGLLAEPGSQLLSGATSFLFGDKQVKTGIELAGLLEDSIQIDDEGLIRIGAAVTLRTLETHFAGTPPYTALSRAVAHIQGPALRNVATAGGHVCMRYRSSELLAVLLAMNCVLQFHHSGSVTLEDYLSGPRFRDILLSLTIPEPVSGCGLHSVRSGDTKAPLLTCAAANTGGSLRIALGATPYAASVHTFPEGMADEAVIESILALHRFGSDTEVSEAYRRAIAPAVIRRALNDL